MNKQHQLTSAQKSKVNQVIQLTNCNEATALILLVQHDWNVEVAIDDIFEQHTTNVETVNPAVDAWFTTYAQLDNELDMMETNGVIQFLSDIGIEDPETDPVVLVLGMEMKAHTMLQYSRSEFLLGMSRLQVTSVKELKELVPMLRKEFLEEDSKFQLVYAFAFQYGLVNGQKVLAKDMALALWKVLISVDRFPLILDFLAYYTQTQKHGVTKDLWQQFGVLVSLFVRCVQAKLNFVQEYGKIVSWPLVLDEFVEHEQNVGRL